MSELKILVLDDDLDQCTLIEEYFKSAKLNVNLTIINDEENLIDTFQKQSPDIIIMDIILLKKDGIFMGKKVRREEFLRVPIIYISSGLDYEDEVRNLDQSNSLFLKKPFTEKELIQSIQNFL